MLIPIFNQFDDGTRYHIGTVRAEREVSDEEITLLYAGWLDGVMSAGNPPDSDHEFVEWLIKTDQRFNHANQAVECAVIR